MAKCRKSSAQSGAFNLENIKVNANRPFTTITNEFIRNSNLSLGAYKTFINLLSYSNNFNITINNLSKLLKISDATTKRYLKELKEKNYLKVFYDKEQKTFIYNLNETPNKTILKPTQKDIDQRKKILEYAIKKANEVNATQSQKQAFTSILNEMFKELDKNKAE